MPRQIVEPQGVIKLLANVPLDTTYDHTIFFADRTTQYNYFAGLAAYSLPAQSYTRQSNGAIRVEINSEQLWLRNVNYLMFQNAGFTAANAKWFYAFITDIVYINNVTSEIRFQLDPMQSWLMHVDYTMKQCFVAREHAITDTAGDNLLDEGLELGDYVFTYNDTVDNHRMFPSYFRKEDFYICIPSTKRFVTMELDTEGDYDHAVIEDAYESEFDENVVQGIYTGLCYNWFKNGYDGQVGNVYGQWAANYFLKAIADLANGESALTAVYVVPKIFKTLFDDPSSASSNDKLEQHIRPDTNGNYTPRNKKLLTYPYMFLHVTDYDGNASEYHYEYSDNWDGGRPILQFRVYCAFSGVPVVGCVPVQYKGMPLNYDEANVISNIPQAAVNLDQFRAWCAQNQGTLPLMLAKTGATIALAAIGGGLGGAAAGANTTTAIAGGGSTAIGSSASGINAVSGAYAINSASNVLEYLRQRYVASTQPDKIFGDQANTLHFANDFLGFYAFNAHIREEYARIIDEYFDKYGYATNRNKIPNIYANSGSNSFPRKVWCYTQTADCNIEGSVPAPIAEAICNIFNKGITFWKHTATVGDYSQDNTV